MADPTALVTGATSGVGRAVAERLGRSGWQVLVHGRDRARGSEVVEAIGANGGRATFHGADLAELADVRDLAAKVAAEHDRLDLLINNAGIGSGASGTGRQESADGHELRLAVNYLAPFLLTRLLLDRVRAAAPARIVNVASAGQLELDFGDLQMEYRYSGTDAYARSKLALIMFTFDLAEELEGSGVAVNTLHPATFMDTHMVREAGRTPQSSVDEGADAIMHLAAGPATESMSGEYFDGMNPSRARPQAYDAEARRHLRDLSFRLTGAL
jgi:NAD(P)-dependent dehydrogenase (short-subunit alcohol dehydrogenase family)